MLRRVVNQKECTSGRCEASTFAVSWPILDSYKADGSIGLLDILDAIATINRTCIGWIPLASSLAEIYLQTIDSNAPQSL